MRTLHKKYCTYSCKPYQRISVLVIEVIFKSHNSARCLIRKKSQGVKGAHGASLFERFTTQEAEIGEKIRAQHHFQNSSISHRRTSQLIRRSPTAYEGGYTFYRNIAKMTSFPN